MTATDRPVDDEIPVEREHVQGWGRLLLLDSGGVLVAPLSDQDVPRIRALMEKYKDVPKDIADAALVQIAERAKEP